MNKSQTKKNWYRYCLVSKKLFSFKEIIKLNRQIFKKMINIFIF